MPAPAACCVTIARRFKRCLTVGVIILPGNFFNRDFWRGQLQLFGWQPSFFIWGMISFLLIFLWTSTFLQIADDYRSAVEKVYARNSTLTQAFEEHVRRSLSDVDGLLQFIKSSYETNGNLNENIKLMFEIAADKPMFHTITIFDANGQTYAVNKPVPVIHVADRAFFRYQQTHQEDNLYIGEPIEGRAIQKSAIPLARRINHADGSFAGVVVATVDPAFFADFYQRMNLEPAMTILIVGSNDSVIRVRKQGASLQLGQNLANSVLFQYAKLASSGNYNDRSVIENVRRFVSYSVMHDFPLIVATGVPEEFALQEYYRDRDWKVIMALLGTVVLLAYSLLLSSVVHRWNQEFRNRTKLQAELERELAAAGSIQKALVPGDCRQGLAVIKTVFEPCRMVSGDFVGYHWLQRQVLRGYVTDVQGHGVATALHTAAMQVLLNQNIRLPGKLGVDRLLSLNKWMKPYFTEDSFAAVLLFELDFQAGLATVVCGGINYFLVTTKNGTEKIAIPGSFVGLTEEPEFGALQVPFARGDSFYFISDGISDRIAGAELPQSFDTACQFLLQLAEAEDSWDDCSAVCIHIQPFGRQHVCFDIVCPDKLQFVRDEIHWLLQSFAGPTAGMLEVAINEALNNSMKACPPTPELPVRIKIGMLGQRRLFVRVRDCGAGFGWKPYITKDEETLSDEELLAESGRGIMIMRAAFDQVAYNRSGNEVLLVKRLESPGNS